MPPSGEWHHQFLLSFNGMLRLGIFGVSLGVKIWAAVIIKCLPIIGWNKNDRKWQLERNTSDMNNYWTFFLEEEIRKNNEGRTKKVCHLLSYLDFQGLEVIFQTFFWWFPIPRWYHMWDEIYEREQNNMRTLVILLLYWDK